MTGDLSLGDLGFSELEIAALMTDVARHAAYQLAAQERGVPMEELAATHTVVDLLGEERWRRLGVFAQQDLAGTAIHAVIDEKGPVITLDEMNRLGALVLGQFLAGETR